MILRKIARVILSLNLSITVSFGHFNEFYLFLVCFLICLTMQHLHDFKSKIAGETIHEAAAS